MGREKYQSAILLLMSTVSLILIHMTASITEFTVMDGNTGKLSLFLSLLYNDLLFIYIFCFILFVYFFIKFINSK